MRAFELDMAGQLWLYTPSCPKAEHHERARAICLGPKRRSSFERTLSVGPSESAPSAKCVGLPR